jgi:hypothetical protein
MPTAAKLFAALSLMMVGFFGAEIIKPHMSDGTQFGAFSEVAALIGLVVGWRVLGPAAGRGNYPSASAGVRAVVILILGALFVFSTENMLVQAFRRTYDGPTQAVVGIIKIALDYGQQLLNPDVAAVLILGGIGSGLLTEWAARRWR